MNYVLGARKFAFSEILSRIQHDPFWKNYFQKLLFPDTPQWLFKVFTIPYREKMNWVELDSG